MRTLSFKLIAAFLLTTLGGVGLFTLLIRQTIVTEFDQLVVKEARENFTQGALEYYQLHNSLAQFDPNQVVDRPPNRPPNPPNNGNNGNGRNNNTANQNGEAPIRFILADASGVVQWGSKIYQEGAVLPSEILQSGNPLLYNGQQIGTVIDTSDAGKRSNLQEDYLSRTLQVGGLSAVIATVFASLTGIVFSRRLTAPLRELTQAIDQFGASKRHNIPVEVRSNDEIGQLANAFNDMQKALARSDYLRRQMTADIAHDLRSPLTVLIGYLEAMRDEVLSPTPARFDTLYQEATHLQRLIDDLRTLSLADAHELTLNRVPVETNEFLQHMVGRYRLQAEKRHVNLRLITAPETLQVAIDPDRMTQVCANLIGNALRYTPADKAITVRVSAQEAAVIWEIADEGTGIAPEDLPNIFERFYRADGARQQTKGESGLGLAIVKSIVEAHDGTIGVTSVVGQGTVFTIRLERFEGKVLPTPLTPQTA